MTEQRTGADGIKFLGKNIYNFKGKEILKVKKTKEGAPYETPTLEIALIERADVITTSGGTDDGMYDENGWT